MVRRSQRIKKQQFSRDVMLGCELWTDGLICAFEFVRGRRKIGLNSARVHEGLEQNSVETQKQSISKCLQLNNLTLYTNENDSKQPSFQGEAGLTDGDTVDGQNHNQENNSGRYHVQRRSTGNCWIPIGWGRISELLQTVQVDAGWASQPIEFSDEEEDITVADVAAPYWERPVGPTWWCHVAAGHPSITVWLSNAQWLHPAISTALRDESKLMSERMKHLLYEVPVRVAGGLLFELLGQSVDNPFTEEDDIPVVLRSWQAQNFLLTVLHVKGSSSNINMLGIAEVQIIFELLQHLRGNAARSLLECIRKSTREMIQEQEAVRGRLFTIQDVMQSTVRAWLRYSLQDPSLHVEHNLGVFGGCVLVLSIITGLFRINVDGIPGNEKSPYAFSLFSGALFLLGAVLIAIGLINLGLKQPIFEQEVEVRKLELQELVRMFQQEAKSHAQVRKSNSQDKTAPHPKGVFSEGPNYLLIN